MELLHNPWLTGALLTALWLLDFALTHLGYDLYRRYARAVLEVEAYELNPLWRDMVERRRRLLDWRVLLILPLFVGVAWAIAHMPAGLGRGALAAVVAMQLYIIGCHLANIASFRYLFGRDYTGHVRMTVRAAYWRHVLQLLTVGLVLGVVVMMSPSPAGLGALSGLGLLLLRFLVAALRTRRQAVDPMP